MGQQTKQQYKPEVTVTRKNGILEVERDQHNINFDYNFSSGQLRPSLLRDIKENEKYAFVSTVANPAAVQALWPIHEKMMDTDDKSFHFDDGLADTYGLALIALAHKHKVPYTGYPLVEFRAGGSHRHMDEPLWPQMHVVPAKRQPEFEELVRELHGKEAYADICRREAPWNYRLPRVDFLREKGIVPLVSRLEWKVDGRTLRQAVNLLCTFSYKSREHSGPGDD